MPRYFNKNNGQVVDFDRPNTRLEYLQNWVTVEDDDHLAELQTGKNVRVPKGLLGSSNVGGDPAPPADPVVETEDPTQITPVEPEPVHQAVPGQPLPTVPAQPGSTPIEPVAPGVPPAAEKTGPDPANRPARGAAKAEWVRWAVECGASQDEAEAMTKADLVEIYSGD